MKKIMIVEDEESLGKALQLFFSKNGYEVTWQKDGDSAVENLSEDIDLYVLDIYLPGQTDGFGIIKKLKEPGSPYRNTPVLVLSNESDLDAMNRAIEMGANDYAIKSNINLESLLKIIQLKLKVK